MTLDLPKKKYLETYQDFAASYEQKAEAQNKLEDTQNTKKLDKLDVVKGK